MNGLEAFQLLAEGAQVLTMKVLAGAVAAFGLLLLVGVLSCVACLVVQEIRAERSGH